MSRIEKYESVIGLEIHAQLLTVSKMFCRCPNRFGSLPNTQICPICTAQPGALPVINKKAVELGVRAAIALNCQTHLESIFARKNYYYPDLPKGYQITQYEQPFCTKGEVFVRFKNGDEKRIGITRIHFEEDAGKSNHESYGTLVNLNRAGVPLIEIVSEPDMRTAHEAGQYLRTIRAILRYADICDGNMEEGNFRCDANISVRLKGTEKFGTRVELKNINSFRFVEKAIEYEVQRQVLAVEDGEKIIQQTRSWNSAKNITEVMREKENAHDYRYFPEPDLPSLVISVEWLDKIRAEMPELPKQAAERFKKSFELSDYDAAVLTSSKEMAQYFEKVVAESKNGKSSANWVMNELLGRLNAVGKEIDSSPVTAEQLSELIVKIDSGQISGKIAKTVFEEMFATGKDAGSIITEKGFVQISDPAALENAIRKVIESHPSQTAEYRAGKIKLLGFFVGQVMKETQGQANPALLNELVKKLLDQ